MEDGKQADRSAGRQAACKQGTDREGEASLSKAVRLRKVYASERQEGTTTKRVPPPFDSISSRVGRHVGKVSFTAPPAPLSIKVVCVFFRFSREDRFSGVDRYRHRPATYQNLDAKEKYIKKCQLYR
jgi:hypothetical protein